MRRAPTSTPWWLEPGEELCEHCLVAYRYEAGIRCGSCDRPICPGCVGRVSVRVELVCPVCATLGEEDD